MDFSRLRPRVAVLLTSGALALAALLAGGCSSPDSDERAQFVSVSGVVLGASGAPVSGAEVFVVPAVTRGLNTATNNGPIGTRNFEGELAPASLTSQVGPFPNGLIGPFPVDPATGAFTIPAVKASPNLANPTVLNIVAWAPGFQPVLATVPAPLTQTVAGRAFIQGVETTDIVVTGTGVSEVRATLASPAVVGTTQLVGVTGASINNGNANLTIQPSALTTATEVTVTGLNQGQVVVFAAAPPQTIPTTGQNLPPGLVSVGQTNAPAVIPLGGLSVSAPGIVSFKTGGATGTITLPVSGLGSAVRVIFFNPANGTWSLVSGSSVSGTTVTFPVAAPGIYAVVIDATWTITGPVASTNPIDTILFPPIATLPNGYTVVGEETPNNLYTEFISFSGVPSDLANLLAAGYSALTGDVATTTPVPFVDKVPAGKGRSCTRNTITVTVSIDAIASLANIRGTRQLWICKDVAAAVQPTVPTHLQGHIQGGGSGF